MHSTFKGTTDALFNLPAFFTSHLWSKRSNAYFYSFEHKSSIKSPGKWFLPTILGNPSKEPSKNEGTNSHTVEDNGIVYLKGLLKIIVFFFFNYT